MNMTGFLERLLDVSMIKISGETHEIKYSSSPTKAIYCSFPVFDR
jgi:hypothetical protein